MSDALTLSKRAFLEASAAAAQVMEAVIVHADVVKAECGLDPAQIAKVLVEKIADTTLQPLQKSGILTDCLCKHCTWDRENAAAYEKNEQRAARVDKALVAKMSNRPHLDAARAEAEQDGPPATPWFDPDEDPDVEKAWSDEARAAALEARRRNQGKWMPTPQAPAGGTPWRQTQAAPAGGPAWRDTPTRKAALDLGFVPGDTDSEYVHRGLGHLVTFADDGFLIKSGWDQRTVLKGETADDLQEAMEVLDQ